MQMYRILRTWFLSKILRFSEISFKGISFEKLTPSPFTFLSNILSFSEIWSKGISYVKLNTPHFFEHNFQKFCLKGFLL